MAKFDLKKAILENKATFFSSLTEGQFSWMTQDTGQQIGSQKENTIPVYMFDNTGKYYYENSYDGYGEFGGVDYYELLDKMNGGSGDRSRGIDLAFGKEKVEAGEVLFPALVTKPNLFNYKYHNFTQEPESDPNQSWYTPEEDDFYDQNDEEEYGDNEDEDDDMMEGLNEGKMYFHVLEDGGYGDIGHQGVYDTKEEAQNRADKLADMFPASSFYVEASDSKDEPYNVTMEENKEVKPNTKMKKSEFKDKIKEMILKEMEDEKVVDVNDETPESEEDFLAELEGMLSEAEDEDTEEVTDDVTTDDVAVDDTETIDTTTTTEVNPDVKAVQDALTQAQAAAQKLGDAKLTDQIGNTITFFTRAHVVEKGAVAENLNENELGTPSEGMHNTLLSYIRQDARATYPKDYNKYFIFLRAQAKPMSGPNKPQIWMKFLKDLVKNKAVSMNDLIDFSEKGYNSGGPGLEGLATYLFKQGNPEILRKIDNLSNQSNINESMFPMLKKILK